MIWYRSSDFCDRAITNLRGVDHGRYKKRKTKIVATTMLAALAMTKAMIDFVLRSGLAFSLRASSEKVTNAAMASPGVAGAFVPRGSCLE
jgi:hypothetical protein